MAIWLNADTGEFTSDGNWMSKTVNDDGSKQVTVVVDHVRIDVTIPAEAEQ